MKLVAAKPRRTIARPDGLVERPVLFGSEIMKSLRLLAMALVSFLASPAIVAAADGKHEYSTGHVVQVDYSRQAVALDNGYVFEVERASDLDRLWIGEGVLIRFMRNGVVNIADSVRHDNAWLVDPPPDSSD